MAKRDASHLVISTVMVICTIGLVLMVLESFDTTGTRQEVYGRGGKYEFSTVQKAVSPKAECKGYLQLDGKGRPIGLNFTLGIDGEQRGKYEYAIGERCQVDPENGASIYDDLRPGGETNSSQEASLRISPNKKMFLVSLVPPPSPWNLKLDRLSINIKNAQGYKDWKVLPPVETCIKNISYTVSEGDAIQSIDKRYGITEAQMLASNKSITDKNFIYPGQKLIIPAH